MTQQTNPSKICFLLFVLYLVLLADWIFQAAGLHILYAICLKRTFSRKLGEREEEERNNFLEAFSYCFFFHLKRDADSEARSFLLHQDTTVLQPCSMFCSHFRNCTEGEQGFFQPRHSSPVTSAFQSRALQETRCDCALKFFIFLLATQMRLICFQRF